MQKKKNLDCGTGKTKARQKQYRPPRTPEPLVGTKRGKNVSQDDRRSETQRVQQADAPANARLAALSKLRSAGTGRWHCSCWTRLVDELVFKQKRPIDSTGLCRPS
jgi:hypothetical protein